MSDYEFKLSLAKDKQRLTARKALRRAKRIIALLKAGRLSKYDKSDLEELALSFDIYNNIFEDACKQENELREAEKQRRDQLAREFIFND